MRYRSLLTDVTQRLAPLQHTGLQLDQADCLPKILRREIRPVYQGKWVAGRRRSSGKEPYLAILRVADPTEHSGSRGI